MIRRALVMAVFITIIGIAAGTIIGQQSLPKEQRKESQGLTIEEERLKILEQDLAKKSEELKKLKEEIAAKIKEQEALKQQLERINQEYFQKLAKIYEAMPPEEAAQRLEKLDDETAALLILAIKPRQAGKILGNVNPEKAAAISKKVTSLRSN